MGLSKHLDSDEKMVLFFRPSRKAFIHQYIFFLAVLALCGYFALYFMDNLYFLIVFGIISIFPLYGLLSNEWKILSNRYAFTNERIFYSNGIFTEDFRSLHYYAITDVSLRQTLWDKIVNTGTLSVNTGGTDYFEINFIKVSDPVELKKKISDLTPKMHGKHMNATHAKIK